MSAPTIHIEVNRHHRRKDGGIVVQIRMRHQGHHIRIATDIVAYADDLSRSGKLRGAKKDRAEDLVRRMLKALGEISYFELAKMDVKQLVEMIHERIDEQCWNLDYFRFAEDYLDQANITASTRATYRNALSALRRFWGFPTLEMNQITVSLLQDFIHYIAEEPLQHYDHQKKVTSATTKKKRSGTGDRLYLAKLATIYRAARTRYNDEDRGIIRIPGDPFAKVRIHAAPSRGQSALPIDVIRMMIADGHHHPLDSSGSRHRHRLLLYLRRKHGGPLCSGSPAGRNLAVQSPEDHEPSPRQRRNARTDRRTGCTLRGAPPHWSNERQVAQPLSLLQ